MAGIYIHIPFCRKKCHYCDFHRSVNTGLKDLLIKSMLQEIELKKNYLKGEHIETIYFGGGTPSILNTGEINSILDSLLKYHRFTEQPEITLEANPDDLTQDYLKNLKNETIINRLSIGIQSFNDEDLVRMNRRHNAGKAEQAIENALNVGFDNLSIDLIYGLPGMKIDEWEKNLAKVFTYAIKHLSAYHLTYEPGTKFYEQLQKGTLKKTEEDLSIKQFELLIEIAEKNGFIHYEISNFAKNGFFSKHNTNYWLQKKYLGLGPSAHSYDLISRHWNISNNYKYIQYIASDNPYFETEWLDKKTRFNEYLMTRLRTFWGINLLSVSQEFGISYSDYLENFLLRLSKNDLVMRKQDTFSLTKKGIFISDYIVSELMLENELQE